MSLVLILLGSSAGAAVTVIDMEGIAPPGSLELVNFSTVPGGGQTFLFGDYELFVSEGAFFDSEYAALVLEADNGSDYFGWEHSGDSAGERTMSITRTDGGLFRTLSFDLANYRWNPFDTAVFFVRLSGTLPNGLLWNEYFSPSFAPDPSVFQTISIDQFPFPIDLDRLEISFIFEHEVLGATGSAFSRAALDNIVLESVGTSPVTEPSSTLLGLSALLGLITTVRRKRTP